MKFADKYRIPSIRIENYNYGLDGAYFVTICTDKRKHLFGRVVNGRMKHSKSGKTVAKYLQHIPDMFLFASLGEWVVMPNHIHCIILIDQFDINDGDAINRVSTHGGITQHHNPMHHNNLSRIIRWFKGRTTYEIRKFQIHFAWQPLFYDHIIRNEHDYNQISEYIMTNPICWEQDDYY